MSFDVRSDAVASRLHSAAAGLLLAVLTLLLGQGMGIAFGVNEDAIKGRLRAGAAAVRDSAYQGDEVAAMAVVDKSWTYLKRAHLHAGGMGTTAVVLILVLCLVRVRVQLHAILSIALGAGGLGYSIFWMWAGFRAPGLGGTGAAKESLDWLAMPSSGAFVLATLAVFTVIIVAWRAPRNP